MADSPSVHTAPARGGTFGPCATAFVASACMMVIELLAFRLVTRYLGNSNYTTTAIIGVVLAGLALGNYVGGLLADRYRTAKTLAMLFVLSSIGCITIPIVNARIGEWTALWFLSWPTRISLHVLLSFFMPCALLGMIGPVVAKAALDRGRGVGRTVGGVYAWGVLGSLLGTFATGFYLIPHFGLFTVNHVVAGILAIMAILYAAHNWIPWAWTTTAAALMIATFGLPFGNAQTWAASRAWATSVGLRDDEGADILFNQSSEYSQVQVIVEPQGAEPRGNRRRVMLIDKLEHSFFNPNRPNELQYGYEKVFAALAQSATTADEPFRALFLGGGGYTTTRHLLATRPKAQVEVVEIDPIVTKAARETFGLADDPRLSIVHLDARQYVMSLLNRRSRGESVPRYKLVFLDALNDFVVPPHLTTLEFHRAVRDLLTDDGMFVLNTVDVFDSGRFIAAEWKTLRETFSHQGCFFANEGDVDGVLNPAERNTFVFVASNRPLPLDNLHGTPERDFARKLRLPNEKLDGLLQRVQPDMLTDDHAPVEYLLADLPILSVRQDVARRFYNRGNRASEEKRYEDAVEEYEDALRVDDQYFLAYLNLGIVRFEQAGALLAGLRGGGPVDPQEAQRIGSLNQDCLNASIEAFVKAADVSKNSPQPLNNLGQVYLAIQEFAAAEKAYRLSLERKPDGVVAHHGRAKALANLGRLAEAKAEFETVIKLQKDHPEAPAMLKKVEALLATSQPVGPTSGPARTTQPTE